MRRTRMACSPRTADIQADELHSYEEGINCLAKNLILDYASPLQLERAMVTARGLKA